jgi:hypothetical protein
MRPRCTFPRVRNCLGIPQLSPNQTLIPVRYRLNTRLTRVRTSDLLLQQSAVANDMLRLLEAFDAKLCCPRMALSPQIAPLRPPLLDCNQHRHCLIPVASHVSQLTGSSTPLISLEHGRERGIGALRVWKSLGGAGAGGGGGGGGGFGD